MTLTHEEALIRLDLQTIEDQHDWMIEAIQEESHRIGRYLTWQEAVDLLKNFLSLETDGKIVLDDWLSCTEVPVVAWEIVSEESVAWGRFETHMLAEAVVQLYMSDRKRKFPYAIEEIKP